MTTDQTQHEQNATNSQPPASRKVGLIAVVVMLILAVLIGAGIRAGIAGRVASANALERNTREAAIQPVSVTRPKLTDPSEEVVLPGDMQAFTDSPIYARTNGYLKRWHADIGARVQAGQLLAEIETPEVDQQLQQARADLETAQANYRLAQSTAARWQGLLKKESVSQQETDEKIGDMAAKKAMADSAASNVRRLEELQGYEKVYAPFSGVITRRNTDVGALITAGSGANAQELFRLAETGRLRVFVRVPEVYQRAAQAGTKATLTLNEFPGRVFTGTLARNSNAIDAASRTLLVEVDVDNPTGELLPGAYVSVHLKLPRAGSRAVTIPVNTMLFRSEGLRVAAVRNGRAELLPIQIGRDFGNDVEVVHGLEPSEQIIVNPPDSIISGQQVRISAQDQSEGPEK
jgi:RND family efflux transporter MFP subunit